MFSKNLSIFFKYLYNPYCIRVTFCDRVLFTDGGAIPISTDWRLREPVKVPERGESPKEQLFLSELFLDARVKTRRLSRGNIAPRSA